MHLMRVWIFFRPADLRFKGQTFVTIRQLTSSNRYFYRLIFTVDSCFNQVPFCLFFLFLAKVHREQFSNEYIQSGFVDVANN